MRLYVKVFKGCPLHTTLWSIVSIIGVLGGILGLGSLYYLISPTEDTNLSAMRLFCVIGIALFIICIILQKVIEKSAYKKMEQIAQNETEEERYQKEIISQQKEETEKKKNKSITIVMCVFVFIFILLYIIGSQSK